LNEKNILLEAIDLVAFYGINNKNLNLIKDKFPNVKINARGESIKLQSENEEELEAACQSLTEMYEYMLRNDSLPESVVENQVDEEKKDMSFTENGSDFILKGRDGKPIKARTPNQHKLVKSIEKNDIVFAIGPAGTGKTYTSVALAVRALKNKQVKKIILTRPAVEAGESLGFCPVICAKR
jgi:phosphate starvation-inducible PhoH-like protein